MKQRIGKRIAVIMAGCIASIAILYGLFVVYILLIAPLLTGFQAYAPTVLPAGVSMTGHKTQQLLYYGNKTVDIAINVPAFYINENEVSPGERGGIYTTCTSNIQPTTCAIRTTSKGQKYQILISRDENDNPSLDTISWVRGKTLIMISIEAPEAVHYINADWNKIVDGFVTVPYGYERGSVVRNTGM